ncbi:hypothetical protein FACS189413_02250 [Bacteroidia bacterium]|nr:hypothetical protein FACS189413_02250 [Bacteroidia bacterium]
MKNKGYRKPVTGDDNLYAPAVYDENEKSYIIKIVNTGKETKDIQIINFYLFTHV